LFASVASQTFVIKGENQMTKESTKHAPENNTDTTDKSATVAPETAATANVAPRIDAIAAITTAEGTVETDPRVDQALGIFSDLARLEVSPTAMIAAEEILSCIPVRKPKNNEFVRVSPDHPPLTTVIYADKEEGEFYFVIPGMRAQLIAGVTIKTLVLTVNQMGAPFIWPVPATGDESSRKDTWNESHRAAYQQAKSKWTKMVADRVTKMYRLYLAAGELPAPKFPDKPWNELLALAFNNRMIDNPEHPVVKAMRGYIP
jgi:hypothetical protein